MRRQSDSVINTLHWDLEEEFSDADTRPLQQYYRQYRISATNYKEIKHEAELDNAYKSDSSEHSLGTTEENNGKGEKRKRRRKR